MSDQNMVELETKLPKDINVDNIPLSSNWMYNREKNKNEKQIVDGYDFLTKVGIV